MEDTSCKVSLRQEKVPKKIIHFSDGTVEEYSDEDEPDTSAQITSTLNPVNFQILYLIFTSSEV